MIVIADDGGKSEQPDDSVSGRSRAVSWKSTTAWPAFSFALALQRVSGDLQASCARRCMGQVPRFIDEQQEPPLTAKIAPNGAMMQRKAKAATRRRTPRIVDPGGDRCL